MSIAVISDIHSNLEALNKVLEKIDNIGVEEIWCLGDLVGYGANPNECVETVREKCKLVIAGNHDWATIAKTDINYFNPVAKSAILWTKEKLDERNAEYLDKRDLKLVKDNFLLVHSSPANPEKWKYLFQIDDFATQFNHFSEKVCLIGHSHISMIVDSELKTYSNKVELENERRYIINVGSVGQPRDGDPRASFGIIDDSSLEIIRVEYDIRKASDKIIQAGLPTFLAERLLMGR